MRGRFPGSGRRIVCMGRVVEVMGKVVSVMGRVVRFLSERFQVRELFVVEPMPLSLS